MLYLLELIDCPRSEEGWRIELYNTHGLERDTILTSYRFHHRKQLRALKRKKKEDGRKKDKNRRASRRGLDGSQSLSASRSSSADKTDLRVRRDKPLVCHDDNHHQLSRGTKPGAFDPAVQDASQGANSEGPSASPRPANQHRENRSSSPAGSSKDFSHQAGEGGRAGSLIDEYDAPFWKKLVTHAEELGL